MIRKRATSGITEILCSTLCYVADEVVKPLRGLPILSNYQPYEVTIVLQFLFQGAHLLL